MHRTKLSLMIWFWAAYLLSQDKRGGLGHAPKKGVGSALLNGLDLVT